LGALASRSGRDVRIAESWPTTGRIDGWWNDEFRRRMIHGEISRVLVLNLLWRTKRCSGTAQENYALDNAFALIEGHP